jgi:hypothetical protein
MGAIAALVSAFDGAAVEGAQRRSRAEIVADQLTALPKDPSQMAAAFPGDQFQYRMQLRFCGSKGGALYAAAPPPPCTSARIGNYRPLKRLPPFRRFQRVSPLGVRALRFPEEGDLL